MSEKIKITIELSQEEFEPIQEMANYSLTSPARIVEALIQNSAQDYLERKDDLIWQTVIGYLREVNGDSPRLKIMEEYIDACVANGDLQTVEERRRGSFGQLDSLEAFEAWKQAGAWLKKLKRRKVP